MSADLRERVARLEKAVEDLPNLRSEVSALKRFQVVVTTLWAAIATVGGFAVKLAPLLLKRVP